MMWEYNTTKVFEECCDELKISDCIKDFIKSWAVTFNRMQTNRSRLYFRSPTNLFEIWDIRVPDPDHNCGSSGGFRLICITHLKDRIIYMAKIESRRNIGFKNERPKDKERIEKYMRDLKTELLNEWSS